MSQQQTTAGASDQGARILRTALMLMQTRGYGWSKAMNAARKLRCGS